MAIAGVQNELAVADSGPAPDDPHPGLRQAARQGPGVRRAVRHDDPAARIASDQITVLSIPRDLKVNIPGHGIDKFNAAYSYGGPKLTLKVVKQLTGIDEHQPRRQRRLHGLRRRGQLDRLRLRRRRPPLLPLQRRAGADRAVRGDRHPGRLPADVRPKRAPVRPLPPRRQRPRALGPPAGVPARGAPGAAARRRSLADRNKLNEHPQEVRDARTSQDAGDLLSLAKLFLAARSAPVVQVHFPANLGGPSLLRDRLAERRSRRRSRSSRADADAIPTSTTTPAAGGSGAGSKGGRDPTAEAGRDPEGPRAPRRPRPALIDCDDLTPSGQQYAAKLADTKTKNGKPMIDFPIYYPTKLIPLGLDRLDATTPARSRSTARATRSTTATSSSSTVPTDGYTGYYGVSGTDWTDPPILANPDETRTIDGSDYLLSWDGAAAAAGRAGRPTRAPTGSTTPARTCSPRARCSASQSRCEVHGLTASPSRTAAIIRGDERRTTNRRDRSGLGGPGDRHAASPTSATRCRDGHRRGEDRRSLSRRRGADPRARHRRSSWSATRERLRFTTEMEDVLDVRAAAVLLRGHAAHLLGRRGPLARAGRRRAAARRRRARAGHEEHRPVRHRARDPPRRAGPRRTSRARSS